MDTAALVPRRYQEEMFIRARKENVIAVLDTGSGKTFISTLLIKHISANQANAKIVFLVPRVPLVEQQGRFLERETTLRISQLHGERGLSDRRAWRNHFRDFDCFVMTPQILYNLVSHSLWSLTQISLIVFDECHNARGNHPYVKVMREYWQLSTRNHRPRIFGMTASPLANTSEATIEGALQKLERSLDCKIVGILQNTDELAAHAPKPKEVLAEYSMAIPAGSYPYLPLNDCLGSFNLAEDFGIAWSTIASRYEYTLLNLGAYCAELYLFEEISHRVANATVQWSQSEHELSTICDLMGSYGQIWVELQQEPPVMDWLSPKVQKLVDILEEYYTPTMQGIIFVQQRQVAYCLARILPLLPALDGKIQCAALTGGNESNFSLVTDWKQVVKSFRLKKFNILIATSVGEEGLDFPNTNLRVLLRIQSCDLVVRFDEITNMDAYIQSRGRARNPSSTFVVMVQAGDTTTRDRYLNFQRLEPELRLAFRSRHPARDDVVEEEMDDATELDLTQRERFVTPVGAVLTYDNAVDLVNYLCALIPVDAFTPSCTAKYVFSDCFVATMTLPHNLPLKSGEDYTFRGPPRQSKKEAKRAVSFAAVKRLHELDIFDDYLLPVSRAVVEQEHVYQEPTPKEEVDKTANIVVAVRDPFVIHNLDKLWIHEVHIDGEPSAGLITGTSCLPTDLWVERSSVKTCSGIPLTLYPGELAVLEKFNEHCIWIFISRKPLKQQLSVLLCPIVQSSNGVVIDFPAMEELLGNPYGNHDWAQVSERDYGQLLVTSSWQQGRHYILHSIQHDTPASTPPPEGSREHGCDSYADYYEKRWSWKTKRGFRIPTGCPMITLIEAPLHPDGRYQLQPSEVCTATVRNGRTLPQGICKWLPISTQVQNAFAVFPALCHGIAASYRAYHARFGLGLPPIREELLIEALTIPSARASFSNQRLETLGDGVLQVLSTVQLFTRYANRHEGQLTDLRQQIVSNRFLMRLAVRAGLPAFITSELHRQPRWTFVQEACDLGAECSIHGKRSKLVTYARRSLQDCMEALLGASFISGGLPAALRCGTAFGMVFGGSVPLELRGYPGGVDPNKEQMPAAAIFRDLQRVLGYEFLDGSRLVEAVTHPSFVLHSERDLAHGAAPAATYERLEFLGDAIIDLTVMEYVFDKFPEANPDTLTRARQRIICAPALAYLAVGDLCMHKLLLCNSADLSIAISRYLQVVQDVGPVEMLVNGWKYEPPKPLSDVMESVFGAVLVDSGWNYDRTREVILHVMDPLLRELDPSMLKDPVSRLMEWASSQGCTKVTFQKHSKSNDELKRPSKNATPPVSVAVHGQSVTEPLEGLSRSVTRGLAAEQALRVLKDEGSLAKMCTCRAARALAKQISSSVHIES